VHDVISGIASSHDSALHCHGCGERLGMKPNPELRLTHKPFRRPESNDQNGRGIDER
jgi:hypothetical protein